MAATRRIAFALLAALALWPSPSSSYEAPFRAKPLGALSAASRNAMRWPVTITCRANLVNQAGYYRQPAGWVQVLSSDREWRDSTWIITISGEQAHARVVDGQGNLGLYQITKLQMAGLAAGALLVQADSGTSTQVISIDAETSSFVYTTQNAQFLWNRATTFVGQCE